ncbi:MAG TPA: alkaline phosphatase D family protein [Hyphomicrobiaceae bacterium]|nr:alkaline phosphatase D family protein [Hyphomicrobiaceae bacterium]
MKRLVLPVDRAPCRLLTRRRLLTSSSAFAVGLLTAHRSAGAGSDDPFSLGVAAGEPSPDGFVLWTRLAREPLAADGFGGLSEPVLVLWEVAGDEGMRQVVRQGRVEAQRRSAHSVHVEVTGLEPNRPYWYRFTALGEQSPIGRARTTPAPADRLERFRFAFASCSNWQVGYFSAYRHMVDEQPDLVLFLGDYIYESTIAPTSAAAGRIVRPHDGPVATDLAGYRNRYALYRTDPDLKALHAAAPCLVTWDDHEVENDYANQWSQDMRVDPAAFLARRAAAYQAYREHMPLRPRAIVEPHAFRLYRRIPFGDLVSFTMLDGRQYRSKQPCEVPPWRRGHVAPPSCSERLEAQRTLLGEAQEAWLFEGFRRADTAWNVLAQGQLMAQLRQKNMLGEIGFWTDGWDGYPVARQRLLAAMAASRLANPVVIGGDIHSFWTTDLKQDFNQERSPTVATEFVGTSITSDPPPYELIAGLLPENPHVRYFESRHRGYVVVDLDRERMHVRFRAISDRRDPKATVKTLKQFVVRNGAAGAIESNG